MLQPRRRSRLVDEALLHLLAPQRKGLQDLDDADLVEEAVADLVDGPMPPLDPSGISYFLRSKSHAAAKLLGRPPPRL
jgi:hypothetical protein